MTRTLWTGLALAAGILVLVASASAVSPSVWHPLSGGEFQSLTTGSVVPSQYGAVLVTPSTTATLPSTPTPPKSGPSATPRPTPTTRPAGGIGDTAGALRGQATWYDDGPGLYAAAGPKLRALIPGYLGRYVEVCARGVCLRLRLVTSCWCVPNSRIVDLSPEAFSRLAPLSQGIVSVSVTW